jgi:hypothetical protein
VLQDVIQAHESHPTYGVTQECDLMDTHEGDDFMQIDDDMEWRFFF